MASGSEDEGDGGSKSEESEVEMVEASTSKMRTERGKGSAAKVKVKAMLKRTTVAPRNPAHLRGLLTCYREYNPDSAGTRRDECLVGDSRRQVLVDGNKDIEVVQE